MGMMWANLLDSNQAVVGEGPLLGITSFTWKSVFDGAGSFSMTLRRPRIHSSQYALLTPERVIEVYHQEQLGEARSIGQFIIKDIGDSISSDGTIQFDISGADILGVFKNFSAKINRVYDGLPTSSILQDLTAPSAGWTIRALASANDAVFDARIDGTPILKAMADIVKYKANHFRLATGRVIEWGAMGEQSSIRLEGGRYAAAPDMGQNDEVLVIEGLKRTISSNDIFNRLYPLGGGQGLAQLTLANAAGTGDYTIKSETINGVTAYYIEDEESIDLYGPIEKTLAYSQIEPIENNLAAVALAAEALYDVAAFDLSRSSTPYYSYTGEIPIVTAILKPGERVALKYMSEDGSLNVNETVWVLSFTQKFDQHGISGSVELASHDRTALDVVEQIGSLVEQASIRTIKPETFPSSVPLFGFDFMRSPVVGNPQYQKNASFEFSLEDYFVDLIACRVNIRTAPLFATAAPTAGGAGTFNWQVTVDTTYPSNIHLLINGVDVSTDFGGPWNAHPADVEFNETFDITDYILAAPSGIFQKHVIELSSEAPGANPRNIEFPGFPAATFLGTTGVVYFNFNILGVQQGIRPT